MKLHRRQCWQGIGALACWVWGGWGLAGPAHAGKAPGNLQVEWRVVSSAQARERTLGVQSGGIHLSTRDAREQDETVHSLLVMNGGRAHLYVGRSVPVTTWQMLLGTSVGAPSAPSPSSPQGYPGTSAQLLSQTQWVDLGQGLTVKPRWSGGGAPVQIEIEAQSRVPVDQAGTLGAYQQGAYAPDGQIQRQDVSSTLAVPLGQWVVVAQSRANQSGQQTQARMRTPTPARNAQGTWSTSDLDDQGDQQLEIRVTVP